MTDDKRPLPTGEHIERQYRQARPLVRALSFLGGAVGQHARDLESQFKAMKRMKAERAEFARRFAPLGWTVFDRFSIDVTHDVVSEPDDDEAERLLTDHHLDPDQLTFLGYRFQPQRPDRARLR